MVQIFPTAQLYTYIHQYFYRLPAFNQSVPPAGSAPPPTPPATTLTARARQIAVARCRVSSRAKMESTNAQHDEDNASKTRRILRWFSSWRMRWFRRRPKVTPPVSPPPMIPPINIGDQLFLESLIRHTEDNILAQTQTRSSTQPLLIVHPRSAPSYYSDEPAPYELPAPPYQERDDFLVNEEEPSSPPRPTNYLLLRSPHPPSSFLHLNPTSMLHSRQPSQARSSTMTSVYEHDGQHFESFDTGILRNCEPPLFYNPDYLSPTAPTPPSLSIPVRAQRQQAQSRRSSQRYSAQSTVSSIQPPPPVAKSRNGSLTVSLRTEEGKEEWEFPTPPRNSGCWFSPRSTNEIPHIEDVMDGEDDVETIDLDIDFLREINAEVEIASHTSSSLGESIASGSASALHTPTVTPHAHTFGLGAKSILSLNGRNLAGNTTNDPSPSKRYGNLSNRCSFDEFDELESVRSVFADLSADMDYDGAGDTLSDTDSFADPAIMRSSGRGLGFAPKPSFLL